MRSASAARDQSQHRASSQRRDAGSRVLPVPQGGRALDPPVASRLAEALGADLSSVRIHTDPAAALAAKDLNANALTLGQHVWFGSGQYRPGTPAGDRLLAHEIVHTVQQSGTSPATSTTIGVSGPNDPSEVEAASVAADVVAGQRSRTDGAPRRRAGPATVTPLAAPTVQCDRGQAPPHEAVPVNPGSSPQYIDTLFERVSLDRGVFTFSWTVGGVEKTIDIPQEDVVEDDSLTFVPVVEPVFGSRTEAKGEADKFNRATSPTSGLYTYCFYRSPEGVILPTAFSKGSTPQFHPLLLNIRRRQLEAMKETAKAFQSLANYLNPVPGTEVDEGGKLRMSSNPVDLLGVLKIGRLRRLKKAGPIRTKLHSGDALKYRVVGPHGKLKGTSVYVLKDADGTVLYVGKGETLDRLREHIKDPKKTHWFGEIAQVEVRGTGLNNSEALALEESLIGQTKPLYNSDLHPFRSVFGHDMEVGPNLPKAQEVFRFLVNWGE